MYPKSGPVLDPAAKKNLDCRKGLQTTVEHGRYSERLKKEEKCIQPEVDRARTIHPDLDIHNTYLSIYRKDDWTPTPGYKYTIDAIQDETPYDPKSHRDTLNSYHARKERGISNKYPLTTTQNLGRLPPLEDFNNPYGRSKFEFH